jgi:hypothetical protein
MRLSLVGGRGLPDGGGSATVEMPCALRLRGLSRREKPSSREYHNLVCGEEMTW